jgi:tetratricopeptide (TPR) repeat protein
MVLHRNLLDAYCDVGDAKAARRHWEEVFRLTQSLASPDREDPQTLDDMALCYDRLGNVCALERNVPASREAYIKLLEIIKVQSAREPNEWHWQLGLSDAHRNLGELELLIAGNAEAAIPWFEKGIAHLRPLEKDGRLATVPLWQRRLQSMEQHLREAQQQKKK